MNLYNLRALLSNTKFIKALQYFGLTLALIAVLLTLFIPVNREALLATGYSGVFVVTMLSAISLLPGPSAIAAFIAGGTLNPLWVSLIAGAGSTIGESTGYLAGYGSHGVFEDIGSGPGWVTQSKLYMVFVEKVIGWMKTHPFLTIFLIAAIPNFFVDIAGVIAGRAKYNFLKFLVAMFLGKTFRFALGAFLGAWLMN